MRPKKSFFAIAVTLLMLSLLSLIGCARDTGECDDGSLLPGDIAEEICNGVDLPPYEVKLLDTTDFSYYTFIPFGDGLSAAAADALVRITPHSLVVIRTEDGNGQALAQDVFMRADPNKWVSTCAQTVRVAYTADTVLLIMSETSMADALEANFLSLMKDLEGVTPAVLSRDNPRYEA